jgi:hypothetical protein
VNNKEQKMIQLITDGRNGRGERVILWRTGEYTYELEIGTGIYKKNLKFYETEYYEALDQFNAAVNNYQTSETV